MWCEHIEKWVRDMDDAPFIWMGFSDKSLASADVAVPIVPTADVWELASLRRLDPRKDSVEVWIKDDGANTVVDKDIFIGFLNPGEGRFVLREMLLDWFIGTIQAQIEKQKCSAPGHGYTQTVRWNADMQEGGGVALVQQWTVWSTGRCLGCTFDPSSAAQFVPDAGPTRNPWSP